MAHIKTFFMPGLDPTWIDMSRWDFRGVSSQWSLRIVQEDPTWIRFGSSFDPYAFAARVPPSWAAMNFVGEGFSAPDSAGFPTQGEVHFVILFSFLDNLALNIDNLDLPLGPLLAAFREGRTGDAVAMLTAGDDLIEGSNINNSPFGISAGDVISGGPGNDTIAGHGGLDLLSGGDGNDLFTTIDRTTRFDASVSAARIDGGAGLNTVSYSDAPWGVAADLSGAATTTDSLKNIQVLVGSTFDDALSGSSSADTIRGGSGADTIMGGLGDDQLEANGTSAARNGGGVIMGGDGNDVIFGDADFNRVNGNTGDDIIVGVSTIGDWLLGGQGNDRLDANLSAGHNIINGNLGNDTVRGGSGGDSLRGGQGDDLVIAGPGSNWISGDLGRNTLDGGSGADTFHAGAGTDFVIGFNAQGGDRIQVDPGVTYTVQQNGPTAVLTFSTGGQMQLQDVQANSLPAGWILG